jgi:sugar O-acyltransferase (sialic acid O-acetyltransferase NeuD family)
VTEYKPLLVLGARKYAAVFADVFDGVCGFRIAGFVENLDRDLCKGNILGLPILWIEDPALSENNWAICCLATTHRKQFVERAAERGMRFATLVHPNASVSGRTDICPGASLDSGVIVSGFSVVGEHVRIGRGATIGHHTRIGPFATIHPGANIAGECEIGEQATVGMGAIIIDGCKVGKGSFVAAGAVVLNDVPDNTLVVGNPARVAKLNYGPR